MPADVHVGKHVSAPVLLFATAATFGASPALISVSVDQFQPVQLAGLRAAFGFPILLIVALVMGQIRRLSTPDLATLAVGGVLLIAVPFAVMAAGLQTVPSGLGGMLYASMPVFTLALTRLFTTDERPTIIDALCVTIGIIGVAIIAGPSFVVNGVTGAGAGVLLILLAPLSYAAGNVWLKLRPSVPPLLLTAGMFGIGAILTLPLSFALEGGIDVNSVLAAGGPLFALVAFATALPAVLNYALVRQSGANMASYVMFLMPGFAVLYGATFLGERLPPSAFVGLALVVSAAVGGEALSRSRAKSKRP